MSDRILVEKMVGMLADVPAKANVYAIRQFSLRDVERKVKDFLSQVSEVFELSPERNDWMIKRGRTLVRLPNGVRATIYHASGALNLVTSLNPMESLFEKVEEREFLIEMVEKAANRLQIQKWAGDDGYLKFERLWQIKAAAADMQGKTVAPVLCRAVGAYRHFIDELPVWGPASVAIKLAGDSQLDSLSILVRETTGELVEKVHIVEPAVAAKQITLQLRRQMGQAEINLSEIASPKWLRFGYLSLPKRKSQRLLAPVYVSAVEIKGKDEPQAYLFAAPATEQPFLPLWSTGSEAPIVALDRVG
jgi:hypothetical protein